MLPAQACWADFLRCNSSSEQCSRRCHHVTQCKSRCTCASCIQRQHSPTYHLQCVSVGAQDLTEPHPNTVTTKTYAAMHIVSVLFQNTGEEEACL